MLNLYSRSAHVRIYLRVWLIEILVSVPETSAVSHLANFILALASSLKLLLRT